MCYNFLSVHTTTAMLETWHWECVFHPPYSPSWCPWDFQMLSEFRGKKIIKVSDFGLKTLSKCRSRIWEQDNSHQGLENLTVCYDKCLQLVWWQSGKIKDSGPNIKMCFTLYLPPLPSVHPLPPPTQEKRGGRKKSKTQFLAILPVCEYTLWHCISHVVLCCRCRMVAIRVTRGMRKYLQLTYCSWLFTKCSHDPSAHLQICLDFVT